MSRKNKADKCYVPAELKERVMEKIKECIKSFYDYTGYSIEIPKVHYNIKGTTAGTAYYQLNIIELNPFLLIENEERFLNRTVPHELAHILTPRYWSIQCGYDHPNSRTMIHGKYWKTTMRILKVEDIGRCHTYKVKEEHRKRQTRYAYGCSCPEKIYNLSATKHNRMVEFRKKYTGTDKPHALIRAGRYYYCITCNKVLLFTGKVIQK